MLRKIKEGIRKLYCMMQRHNIHLQTKLIASYMVVIIIPLAFVGLYSYWTLENAVMDEISGSIDQTIMQTGRMISMDMSRAREISDLIYINPKIQKRLSSNSKMDFSEFQSFIIDLRVELNYLTKYSNDYNVVVYYKDENPVAVDYFTPEFQSESKIKDGLTYSKLIQNKNEYYWGTTKLKIFGADNSESIYVTLLRNIKSLETGEHIGTMALSYSEKYISDILQEVKLGESGFLFVMDESGRIVSHHNKELLMTDISDRPYAEKIKKSPSGSFTQKIENESYLFNYNNIEGTDWCIVGVVKVNELTNKLGDIRMAIIFIGTAVLIVAVLFSIKISNGISRRIKKLAKAMKRVEEGNLDVNIKSGKPADEISLLYKGFNSMQEEIRNLIEQIKVTNQKKRSAELKALQHQINPHFLYNTLDSINWMAASRYKANDISMMVTSLANLFRLSLNKSNNITTVKNEIEHVRSYVNIQKIRFDYTFDVMFEVEHSLDDFNIIKLILQPLVENSILHGFKDIEYKGEILIKVFNKDEEIHFEVSDNGVGCDVELMNGKLLDSTNLEVNKGGYGVKNVDERIKLCYGNEYGIKFYDNGCRGTTVLIRLPISTSEGGVSIA